MIKKINKDYNNGSNMIHTIINLIMFIIKKLMKIKKFKKKANYQMMIMKNLLKRKKCQKIIKKLNNL